MKIKIKKQIFFAVVGLLSIIPVIIGIDSIEEPYFLLLDIVQPISIGMFILAITDKDGWDLFFVAGMSECFVYFLISPEIGVLYFIAFIIIFMIGYHIDNKSLSKKTSEHLTS